MNCRQRGAQLASLSGLPDELLVLNNVLGGAAMSFWTGLNILDSPGTGILHGKWYIDGQGFVSDTGYRGSLNRFSEANQTTYADGFCAAWLFTEGISKGLTLSSCSNIPRVVEGYICQFNTFPWVSLK